jgi:hypothetical protein
METYQVILIVIGAVQLVTVSILGLMAWGLQKNILITHRNKLRMDLFGMRHQIYWDTLESIRSVMNSREDSFSELVKFFQQTEDKARFLFNSDVMNFLERVRKDLAQFNCDNLTVRGPLTPREEQCKAQENISRFMRDSTALFTECREIFSSYLSSPEDSRRH